ncbi:MAG TPA: bifunctional 3-demethylubiquinone 3-O-methyltransferase/2-octaprenyl-6-hydroxy phenol methylase, partial [Actinoplanes sp.]
EFAQHDVRLQVRGARPSATGLIRWLALRRTPNGRPLGRIVPTRSTAVLYQGVGRKSESMAPEQGLGESA